MGSTDAAIVRTARRLHADLPVVDGHNDLPWALRTKADRSLEAADPGRRLDDFHTDLPRMLTGGVGGQFWSVFVPAWVERPLAETHRQIDLVEEMSNRAPGLTALAASAAEVASIRTSGRIAGLIGAEGGHCIENDLAAIEGLYERGVRYLTLTHAATTDWADSATDVARHGGLTDFGRAVVEVLNRIGMLVDVSHVSADTMRDAIAASRAPVIASHSSAFALAPHPRNLPDDVLEMLAATGGVAMVTFVPPFLVEESALAAIEMFDEMRELRSQFAPDDELGYAAAARDLQPGHGVDNGTVSDVVDHIEHITRLAGVESVGIGGDFDGVDQLPEGLEDVSRYPAITEELLQRGWSEADIRKVLGENALRVLEMAEEVANHQ